MKGMKMKHEINRMLVPGLLLALAAGCATRPAPVPPPDPRVMVDSSAAGLVRVTRVDYGVTAGRTPSLHVAIRGDSLRDHVVEYKIDWFHDGGQPLDSAVPVWRRARLAPGEMRDLRFVAPAADVDDFRLQIRRAD